MRKVAVIGGGGVRTPLIIHGLVQAQSALETTEVTLFDVDVDRAGTIARIGREVVRSLGGSFEIRVCQSLEDAVSEAEFVLNSVRVGGMAARARDERIAIHHGYAGQETTGPGGAAMALRTLPVTLQQAKLVEQTAPEAWFINFTNPAGLITQALTQQTNLKVIGICDTPTELFHRIATAVREPVWNLKFDYAGLNHLGWIRSVYLKGEDITGRILSQPAVLRDLYPASLFDPELIQTLGLIPTEYLFFYYSQQRAYKNQMHAGATRGEELQKLNAGLFKQLAEQSDADALKTYRDYLSRRNASYMKLEAESGSAFATEQDDVDPFNTATGYHRIALDVMTSLVSDQATEIVLNVRNDGAMEDLEADDIVEVPCSVDRNGARANRVGRLPESVRGLVLAVKAYERTAIRAALAGSASLATLAMLEYPVIGQWESAVELTRALRESDPSLAYLK